MYAHVQPVIGIQSNHPLDKDEVYPDDAVLHYSGGDVQVHRRVISSLPGEWNGPGHRVKCGGPTHQQYNFCSGNPYGFGWAVTGFALDTKQSVAAPASLHVQPWKREPYYRSGDAPQRLRGTLTVSGLSSGARYAIYRWDSVRDAFSYSNTHRRAEFTAASGTYVYVDTQTFMSDGATFYRAVKM